MKNHLLLLIIFGVLLAGCAGSRPANSADASAAGLPGVYQSLADHLRRHPAVRFVGAGNNDLQVFIRGIDNIIGEYEPLFVIDGAPAAESYAHAVRLVDVNDIRSVQVLNVSEATAHYGLRGSRGAVVIRTRKN